MEAIALLDLLMQLVVTADMKTGNYSYDQSSRSQKKFNLLFLKTTSKINRF